MPSSSSSTTTIGYKGKLTNRSWQQLPPEILRVIATYYLLDASASNYCPNTWGVKEIWPCRIAYTVIRDALDLERMMNVCPAWHKALQAHLFWTHACAIMDPMDILAQHANLINNTTSAATQSQTPHQQFRTMTSCSCYVCRINHPYSNSGLGMGKRTVNVPLLGTIMTCRDHRKALYCGLCLREAPPTGEVITVEAAIVACVENEDTDTWPNVATTCRTCRGEWLWRRMYSSAADREAMGGGPPHWAVSDWESRQAIDNFVEMGEGTLMEVVEITRERWWLRRFTRFVEQMEQMVASNRLLSGEDKSFEDMASADMEDFEGGLPDPEQVRVMAVNDWARVRILDGYWVSPADDWYNNRPASVSTMHPIPWSLDDERSGQTHPTARTLRMPAAPTFTLADTLYRAFQRQMRILVLPAMMNIAKRIEMEGRGDPVVRVSRMGMDEVLRTLQQGWPWVKELPFNDRAAEQRSKDRDDDSSSSSKSDGSHTTSPVLSTTTLQTTPSPPPIPSQPEKHDSDPDSNVLGPADDIISLQPSKLMHSIPFVPVSLANMPNYSQEAFRTVWREACTDLYKCRCRICMRSSLSAAAIASVESTVNSAQSPVTAPQSNVNAPEIQIEETRFQAEYQGEEREEEEEDDEGEEVEDEDEEAEDEDEDEEDEDGSEYDSVIDDAEVKYPAIVTPRKRPSRELDEDDEAPDEASGGVSLSRESDKSRVPTPPKRARIGGVFSSTTVADTVPRLEKRRSEELSTREGDTKRARMSPEDEDEDEDDEEVQEKWEDGHRLGSVSPPASSELTRIVTGANSSEVEGYEGSRISVRLPVTDIK